MSFSTVLRRALALAAAVAPAVMELRAEVFPLPGYRMVVISPPSPGSNAFPSINNSGQIVWQWEPEPFDATTWEIMLWDHGQVTQITDNSIADAYPHINDDGIVVWSSATGLDGELEIWTWQKGVSRRLVTHWPAGVLPQQDNWTPKINGAGHVVWSRSSAQVCSDGEAELWWSDGTCAGQLTASLDRGNQAAQVNDLDEVIWTEYNFCEDPWQSRIMLYSGGAIIPLSPPSHPTPQVPRFSEIGWAVWRFRESPYAEDQIALYQDGNLTTIPGGGRVAVISNAGAVALGRNDRDTETSQVWLYRDGRQWPLTAEPLRNAPHDANDALEIVWVHGDPAIPQWELRAFLRYDRGDLNCDGAVSMTDISAFIGALLDAGEYQKQFPACDRTLADLDMDGAVSVTDIAPFVAFLTG